MDSRGIPIVVPGTPRRTPKNTPTRYEHHTSPFIINSLKNEKSLLEVYDSFADACFQSHFNHSIINEDYRYNIHSFYKTEACPSDNIPISASLAPSPTAASRTIPNLTFECRVPEDMDFDNMRSGSNMLESISTTYSQATFNLQKRELSEVAMPIDDQLVGISRMDYIPMEVDNEQVDPYKKTTNELIDSIDTKKFAETEAQQISSINNDSNTERAVEQASRPDVLQAEKIDAVSPQRATAYENPTFTTQINKVLFDKITSSTAGKASIKHIEDQQTDYTPLSKSESANGEFRSVIAVTPNRKFMDTIDKNIPQEKFQESHTEEIIVATTQPPAAASHATKRRLRPAASASSAALATEILNILPIGQPQRKLKSRNAGKKISEAVVSATAISPRRVTRSQANTPDQSPTTHSRTGGRMIPSTDLDLIEKRKSTAESRKGDEEKTVKTANEKKDVSSMEAMEIEILEKEVATTSKIDKDEILTPKDDNKERISGQAQNAQMVKPNEEEAVVHNQNKEESVRVEVFDKESEDWEKLQEQRRKRDEKEIGDILKKFPNLSNYYELVERAGRGTFSKVYKAKDLFVDYYMPLDQKYKLEKAVGGADASYVAIKVIFDISSPRRVMDEISCLLKFRSSPCITPLIAAFRNEAHTYAVLPYIDFDHFDEFYLDMTLNDVRSYISQLLIGLKYVHAEHIMHRDVKPGNFLYNNATKVGYLADFGLAQSVNIIHRPQYHVTPPNHHYTQAQEEAGYYIHDTRPNIIVNRSGTKGFRAPEVLMRYRNQTTAIDIWAVGVILLIILSGRYPFFEPEDDADGIIELAHVFGMKKLKEFTEYYGRKISTNIPTIPEDEVDLGELCQQLNKKHVEKWNHDEYLQAIDLLKNCLQLIHTNRYTADEALKHPFLNNHALN